MSRRNDVMALFDAYKEETDARVNAGIEANRKGTFTLAVRDKDGNPVSKSVIRLSQRTHDFRFGANLFMLDELETPEKNAAYRADFARLFNMATIPFYWNTLEPDYGKPRYAADSPKIYRRPAPDLCLQYCAENNIEPREHALSYTHHYPAWISRTDVFQNKCEMERHFREIAERYADRIRTIEVTNELFWKDLDKEPAIYKADDYLTFAYKLAEKYFPSNELTINEYGLFNGRGQTTDMYYSYIENTLLKGCRIDAIGMQYHMFFPREREIEGTRKCYDPQQLFRILDLYANFNKPMQITEITIPAYSNDAEDEDVQAEILTTLYRLWFSYPNMEQILYWNLVDGYANGAAQGDMTCGENTYFGGLVRFDFTKKTAYTALYDLIHREWHTETALTADEGGKAVFRGFYGEYDVTVETEHGQATVPVHCTKDLFDDIPVTLDV